MITVVIRPCQRPKGRGFWKFNVSLLDREDLRQEFVKAIEKADQESGDLPADTRWEFIKLHVREFSIQFSKKVTEERVCLESELETHLMDLEKDLFSSPEIHEEYQATKRELHQFQLLKAREAMIRSKIRWVGEGERPTKFFLNLQKKQSEAKTISSIHDGEGNLLTDSAQILAFQHSFFTDQ